MHANDTRHFPLTYHVYRMCRIIVDHFFAIGEPAEIVYGNHPFLHRVMADLVDELEESGEYETAGARNFGALFFAVDAMKTYHPDPRDIGFFMPKA
ncbi:hypothetical protein NPS70_16220 [Streptomyces sp. C10-9-1]|uniref:hypothetical protein n=1 Tax=Streptomyces sp. C10-9-1 TaxID=1859285 RepID=UPI0021135EFD|nr:hypothetical protein [Streptomyces sp. C10-9-1]MCQ6554732.1 hypothetical protein [Streptomyces sp. C10-9-1]